MLKFLDNRPEPNSPRSPIKFKPAMVYGHSYESPRQFSTKHSLIHTESYANPYWGCVAEKNSQDKTNMGQQNANHSQQQQPKSHSSQVHNNSDKHAQVKPKNYSLASKGKIDHLDPIKHDLRITLPRQISDGAIIDHRVPFHNNTSNCATRGTGNPNFNEPISTSLHLPARHASSHFHILKGQFTDFMNRNLQNRSIGPLQGSQRTNDRIEQTKKSLWLSRSTFRPQMGGSNPDNIGREEIISTLKSKLIPFNSRQDKETHKGTQQLNRSEFQVSSMFSSTSSLHLVSNKPVSMSPNLVQKTRIHMNREQMNKHFKEGIEKRKKKTHFKFDLPGLNGVAAMSTTQSVQSTRYDFGSSRLDFGMRSQVGMHASSTLYRSESNSMKFSGHYGSELPKVRNNQSLGRVEKTNRDNPFPRKSIPMNEKETEDMKELDEWDKKQKNKLK